MSNFSDDFNRGDSGTLGANYDQPIGNIGIESNTAKNVSSATEATAYWAADAATVDLFAQSVIVKAGSGTTGFGVVVRKDATPATQTYYYFEALFDFLTAPQNTVSIYKVLAGVYGSPIATASFTLNTATAYVIRAEVSTSGADALLVLKMDGATIISFTDSASPITTGQRAGLRCYGSSQDFCIYDDFMWGDLVAPPPGSLPVLSAFYNRMRNSE